MDSPIGPGTTFPACESSIAASARKSRNSGWRSNCGRMVSGQKLSVSATKLQRGTSKPTCSILSDATSHVRNGRPLKPKMSGKLPSARRQSAPKATLNLRLQQSRNIPKVSLNFLKLSKTSQREAPVTRRPAISPSTINFPLSTCPNVAPPVVPLLRLCCGSDLNFVSYLPRCCGCCGSRRGSRRGAEEGEGVGRAPAYSNLSSTGARLNH